MENECVYGCIHPWWGGSGSCTVADTGGPACVCGAGYASRDAKGNASCVPNIVLVGAYLSLAMVSVMVAAVTVRNINQYRHLPVRIQSTKKTSIRIRALVSMSLYVTGFGSVGFVLAVRGGKTTYADPGVLQTIYIVLLPSMVFGIAMMAQYWVECLPSQVFAPGTFAGMLRNASESGNAFVLLGLANGSPISLLGVLMLFFEEWPQKVADMVVGAVTVGTMGVILFVAVQTTGVINQALAKGSVSSKAFYLKARKNLWRQAVTLCVVACVVITVTVVKQLTVIGQGTPSVISTIQILSAHAAAAAFASATRFEAPRSAAKDRSCADRSCAERSTAGEQRRSTVTARCGDKGEPTSSEVQNNNIMEENDAIPVDVVVKSEPRGREKAKRHCRTADFGRVLPINETEASSRSSSCRLPQEEC